MYIDFHSVTFLINIFITDMQNNMLNKNIVFTINVNKKESC